MKIQNRQQLLLILTIVAGGLLLADKILIGPLESLWDGRQAEVAELTDKVKKGKGLIHREQALRSQWSQMQTNSLPNNDAVAQERLLTALHEFEQESGVTINGIVPQWKDGEEYRTITCRIDAAGQMDNLVRFLYDIEKGPMGVRIESFDLNARDATGRQLAMGLQVSGLVLTTSGK